MNPHVVPGVPSEAPQPVRVDLVEDTLLETGGLVLGQPAAPIPTAVFSHLRIAFLSNTTASSCASPVGRQHWVSVLTVVSRQQAPGRAGADPLPPWELTGGLGLACQVLQVE